MKFTKLMARASIVKRRPGQFARNALFSIAGVLLPVRHQMVPHWE